jgi:hypothetical protein
MARGMIGLYSFMPVANLPRLDRHLCYPAAVCSDCGGFAIAKVILAPLSPGRSDVAG